MALAVIHHGAMSDARDTRPEDWAMDDSDDSIDDEDDALVFHDNCPSCLSPRVGVILFGVKITPELLEEFADRRTVFSERAESDDDPRWRCKDCGHEWGRWSPDD